MIALLSLSLVVTGNFGIPGQRNSTRQRWHGNGGKRISAVPETSAPDLKRPISKRSPLR
jgi:hypothetical protein